MKKLLIIVMICFTISIAHAQSTPTNTTEYIYCQLIGRPKLNATISVSIDIGQKIKPFSEVVDKNNKPIIFNSMVDAMNYMGQNGWEIVYTNALPPNVHYWLLKKDISNFSEEEQQEIHKGIMLEE